MGMESIDGITLSRLSQSVDSLRRQYVKYNALESLRFIYELESAKSKGINVDEYIQTLDYIINTNGDMPLKDVNDFFNEARAKKQKTTTKF